MSGTDVALKKGLCIWMQHWPLDNLFVPGTLTLKLTINPNLTITMIVTLILNWHDCQQSARVDGIHDHYTIFCIDGFRLAARFKNTFTYIFQIETHQRQSDACYCSNPVCELFRATASKMVDPPAERLSTMTTQLNEHVRTQVSNSSMSASI